MTSATAHRVFIPLVALLAVLPLLAAGPSCGHDFDFHLLSWLEAASQFAHRHYPHWAYTPAFNAGEPRFLFYPPLSWALGATLGMLLPWTTVPAAFTFIALTLAGFAGHRLALQFTRPHAALLAATLYMLNPYLLFTAYERTAYGELLAAAFIPLLLGVALAPRIRLAGIAVPIALLWLTNAPAAVMCCYALAFVTGVRISMPATASARARIALPVLGGTLLGLTLAAFYLVPPRISGRTSSQTWPSPSACASPTTRCSTTCRQPPTTSCTIPCSPPRRPSHCSSSPHSLPPLVTARPLTRPPNSFTRFLPLLLLAACIAFLLTPLSLPIWSNLPELRFLQFPWRLAGLLAAVLTVFAALAFERVNPRPLAVGLIALALAAVTIFPAWHSFRQVCDDEDNIVARTQRFHSTAGTEPTDEYTPTDADNEALQPNDPPYWLLAPGSPMDAPAPTNARPGQAPAHLELDLQSAKILVLNRRRFPGWTLTLNKHAALPTLDSRNDGLLTLALPAGHDRIDLSYETPADQCAGIALSLLSLGVLATLNATALHRRRAIR